MRPALKAGLHRLRRDDTTVQLGVDPRRAVCVASPDGVVATERVLDLLDGSRDLHAVRAAARDHGICPTTTDHILGLLAAGGVLDDVSAAPRTALPPAERERLLGECATAALVRQAADAGAATLARRQAALVRVYGAGRIGAPLASLLGAAGVGHLVCLDSRLATPADVTPGGLTWSDLGRPRQVGAAEAVRRASLATRVDEDGGVPDLAVLALAGHPDPVTVHRLQSLGVPHLLAQAYEGIGVVGPLVVPGQSACLHCLDLTRSERDPNWPRIVAQLAARAAPAVCDAALAAAVAAHAAMQALAFLDTAETATLDGALELVLPDWRWRRRSWPPHPKCRCGAASGQQEEWSHE